MRELISIISVMSLLGITSLQQTHAASNPSISALIIKAREAKGQVERTRLLKAISDRKPKSQEDVSALLEAMTDRELSRACQMAVSRVKAEDTHLSQPFVKALRSRDKAVRFYSVRMVGKLKAKEAIPELRRIAKKRTFSFYLNREDAVSIGDALHSLGEIGDEGSIPLMMSWIKDFGANNGGVAGLALQTLGKGAVLPIVSCAHQTKDKEKGKICTYLIRGVKGKEAAPILLKVVKDKKYSREIRGNAIEAMGYIGDSDSLEGLKEIFKTSNDYVKKNEVLFAFKHAKNKGGIPLALEALRDRNAILRTGAVHILGEIGDESVVQALEEALRDPDRAVRRRAVRALKKITGKDYERKGRKKGKDAR